MVTDTERNEARLKQWLAKHNLSKEMLEQLGTLAKMIASTPGKVDQHGTERHKLHSIMWTLLDLCGRNIPLQKALEEIDNETCKWSCGR